jgi:hypothetical protein
MTAPNSIKARLDEAKYVMRRQMARIAELEAEVERLRSAAGAHVLRSIYTDANQPTGHRLKAAGLALGHESPLLKPVEAPLDLVAEPIEPLADIVRRQRARADKMLREDPQFQALRNNGYLLEGNGNDDGSDNST